MNWDLLILNPLVIIILLLVYYLFVRKNPSIASRTAKIFLAQTFFFWFALAIILQDNFRFQNIIIQLGLNNIEGMGIVVSASTLLYAIIAMIPLNFFLRLNHNRLYFKIFHYSTFVAAIIGIIFLLIFQNIAAMIVCAIFLGFAIVVRTNYIMKYNDVYNKKFFPFKTIGIVSPLFLLSMLLGYEITSSVVVANNGSVNYLNVTIILLIALISVVIAFVLFILFDDHKDFNAKPYSPPQRGILEPFNWRKLLLIFILTFFVVAIKEISHSYIYLWLLGQRTWEQYHSKAQVDLFLRVNKEMFLIPQFLAIFLISKWLYNKVGVKYLFAGGLIAWFAFFTIGAFNHSAIAFLVLQLINGLAFGICFSILLGITMEWKHREANNHNLMIQFQFIWFGTQLLCNILDNSLFLNKVGIYGQFTGENSWFITTPNFADKLDDITTIIFAVCAIIILVVLVIFYYLSDYIFAEYSNHLLLLIPKLNIIARDNFLEKIKSEV